MLLNGQQYNSSGTQEYESPNVVWEPVPSTWRNETELKSAVSSTLGRVFVRMFLALLVTALTAFAVIYNEALFTLVFGNVFILYGLMIATLGLVVGISAGINKLSMPAANALFFTYAALNGVTLSSIFLVYNLGVIYLAFGITALTFGAMAIFGAVTKRDLSSVGSLFIMGLIGIFLASILNLFLGSPMLEFVISYVGVFVFIGLTAYDSQRIKRMLTEATAADQKDVIKKISVIGALHLYLDFINMFLFILRIFGRRS